MNTLGWLRFGGPHSQPRFLNRFDESTSIEHVAPSTAWQFSWLLVSISQNSADRGHPISPQTLRKTDLPLSSIHLWIREDGARPLSWRPCFVHLMDVHPEKARKLSRTRGVVRCVVVNGVNGYKYWTSTKGGAVICKSGENLTAPVNACPWTWIRKVKVCSVLTVKRSHRYWLALSSLPCM